MLTTAPTTPLPHPGHPDAGPAPDPRRVTDRTVVVRVADGFDGAVRVATMLRGRRYEVRDFAATVHDGLGEVRVTVAATAAEAELLRRRLERFPAVVTAAASGRR